MLNRSKYITAVLERNENMTTDEANNLATSALLIEAGVLAAKVGVTLFVAGAGSALYTGMKRSVRIHKEAE